MDVFDFLDMCLKRVVAWIRARIPPIIALLVPALLALGLRLYPLNAYWVYGYEMARLYHNWPWVLLIIGPSSFIVGCLFFSRHGRPMFFPGIAAVAVLLTMMTFIVLAFEWTVDWELGRIILAVIPIFIAFVTLSLALVFFSDAWRIFYNAPVVGAVIRRVHDEPLSAVMAPDQVTDRSRRHWGSPHRLAILTAYYELQQAHLVSLRSSPPEYDARRYLHAGSALVQCLAMDWPDQGGFLPSVLGAPSSSEANQRRVRVLLQMLAVGLWYIKRNPEDAMADELRGVVLEWSTAVQSLHSDADEACRPLLDALVRVGIADGPMDAFSFRQAAADILDTYPQIPAECEWRDAYAGMWLVVAPDSLPANAVIDIWRALRQPHGLGLSVAEHTQSSPDPLTAYAAIALRDVVSHRQRVLPTAQQSGLQPELTVLSEANDRLTASAAETARARADTSDPALCRPDEGRPVPSWLYRDIWNVEAVRRLIAFVAIVPMLVTLSVICARNPHTSAHGANSISHVNDPRWYAYHGPDDFRVMAHSKPWIALGAAKRGLVLTNTDSRLSRDNLVRSPVLDLVRGMEPGGFLVLSEDQGVRGITPGRGLFGGVIGVDSWIPAPRNAWWSSANQSHSSDILASDLDEAGWLVVLEGRGVARYRLAKGSDGRLVGTRTWQTGTLSDVRASQAVVVSDGVWLAKDGGGIVFADRDTLGAVRRRSVSTPRISSLDANYTEDWASARDADDGLWIYSDDAGSWRGPLFGHVEANAPRLRSTGDVTGVRTGTGNVWLTSGSDLFSYDTIGRRMTAVLPGINPRIMQRPYEASSAPRSSLLVGSESGLYLVSGPRADGTYRTKKLASASINSLSVAENGKRCLYLDGSGDVGSVSKPFSGGKQTVLLEDRRWRRVSGTLKVLSVRENKQGILFITTDGIFNYKGGSREYVDGSRSRIPSAQGVGEHDETIDRVTAITDDGNDVVIIANDQPHILNTDASAGQALWTGLDPTHTSHPTQVAQSQGRIFGQGRDGRIYVFARSTAPRAYPSKVPSTEILRLNVKPGGAVKGDLSTSGDMWYTAFIYGGRLVTYDSQSGEMTADFLPRNCQPSDIAQVRLADTDPMFLLQSGELVGRDGATMFSGGSLPFSPSQLRALCPGGNDSVLVGGPAGRVASYRWADGSWATVGSGSIPGAGPNAFVTEVTSVGKSVFARLSTGGVSRAWSGGWSAIPGCRRVVSDRSNRSGYFLFHSGLRPMNVETGSPDGPTICGGLDPSDAETRWTHAWQPTPTSIMLLTGGPKCASYDAETDSWSSDRLLGVGRLHQYVPFGRNLAALDGARPVYITAAHNAEVLSEAPSGAVGTALASDGSTLYCSWVVGKTPVVYRWRGTDQSSPDRYSRGGSQIPNGFNPSAVVLAAAGRAGVLLFDASGQCVQYDPRSGHWSRLRLPVAGQAVWGWVDGPSPALVLTTSNGVSVVARPAEDGHFSERRYKESVRSVLSHMKYRRVRPATRADGVLLSTRPLLVTRSAGRTSYAGGIPGSRMPLRLTQKGFAEDSAMSAVVTGSGTVWALNAGRLFQLAPDDPSGTLCLTGRYLAVNAGQVLLTENGRVQLRSSSGSTVWSDAKGQLRPATLASDEVLASVSISGCNIRWVRTRDGIVRPVRDDGSVSRFTGAGRLDFQTVRDVAAVNGRLLIAMPRRVVVRDSTNTRLIRVEQGADVLGFIKTHGPDQVYARCADGRLGRWGEDRLGAVAEAATSLRTGGIDWHADLSSDPAMVAVSGVTDGRVVSWHQTSQGWRLDCDSVRSLARNSDGSSLLLDTRYGCWPFDIRGYRRSEVQPRPGREAVRAGNAAVTASSDGHSVTFRTADGGPAFVGGHLFYESSAGIASYKDGIYVLVPGRGIVRRDGARPELITGFWKSPSGIPGGTPDLQSDTNGIRLIFASGQGPVRSWTLDLSSREARWKPGSRPQQPPAIRFGPITWRSVTGDPHNYVPWVTERNVRTRVLSGWWQGDRFAWDRTRSVGLLPNGEAVTVTPAGLVVWADDGSFLNARVWPASGMSALVTAQRRGQPVGLLIRGEGSKRYLVTPSSTRVSMDVRPAAVMDYDRYPALYIEERPGKGLPRQVRFTERWRTGDPFAPVSEPMVHCALPQLPADRLLYDGKFVFDQGRMACPTRLGGGGQGQFWAVYGPAPGRGVISLNELCRDPATGRTGLAMCSLSAAPARLTRLRTDGSGLLALDDANRWWSASIRDGTVTWSPVPNKLKRELLRTGAQVRIDTDKLRWSSTPRYVGESLQPLLVTPIGYEVFARQGRQIALSFDIITSISVDAEQHRVAIGTLGGVFAGPYRDDGRHLLTLSAPGSAFTYNRAASDTSDWVRDVERVRHDPHGSLFVKFAGDRFACLLPSGAWQMNAGSLPEEPIIGAKVSVQTDKGGLIVGSKPCACSNETWSRHTPITDIIGRAFDPSTQTLWICDRQEGLFRIALDRVRP